MVNICSEQPLAASGAWAERRRVGAVQKPHEQGELHPIGKFVKQVVEPLIAAIVGIGARHVVGMILVRSIAGRKLLNGLGE